MTDNNIERLNDYLKEVTETNTRLTTTNAFYAGLIFGLLGCATLWIIWGIARWAMAI